MNLLSIYLGLFCVGCWEANILMQHKVTAYSSHDFIHGYVYTLFACVTNMTAGVFLCMFSFFNRRSKHNDETSITLMCFLSMWSALLFIGMLDDDIRTGPFQPVIIAQCVISLVGILLCCCTCIGLACVGKKIQEYKPVELPV
jgi:hypothetical protein